MRPMPASFTSHRIPMGTRSLGGSRETVGTTAHREMQWHALVGSSDTYSFTGSKWAGGNPSLGDMDLPTLDALCEVLAAHTADPAHCFFGLCTINSWEDSFGKDELRGQRLLKLPLGRDHIVLAAPLSAVDQIIRDRSRANMRFTLYKGEGPRPEPDPSWLHTRQAPNLIWPADHTWLVAIPASRSRRRSAIEARPLSE